MSQPTRDSSYQPGDRHESDTSVPAGTDAGEPASSSEFGGIIADLNAASPTPSQDATSATNPNRNLSDIIRTIRDDGPPGDPADRGGDTETTHARKVDDGPAPVVTTVSAVPRHSGRRPLTLMLLLVLVALVVALPAMQLLTGRPLAEIPAYGLLTGAIDGTRHFLDRTQSGPEPAEVRYVSGLDPEIPARLQELQGLQAQIIQRLDALEARIAAIGAEEGRTGKAAPDEAARLQQRVMQRIDALEARVAAIAAAESKPQKPAREKPATAQSTEQTAPATVKTAREQPRGKPAADVPAPAVSAGAPDSGAADPAVKGSEGIWVLNVASSTNVDAIRALMERLNAMGVKSEQQTVTVNGQTRYRLRIPGFETRQSAREFADRHAQKLRIKDPWISKQ